MVRQSRRSELGVVAFVLLIAVAALLLLGSCAMAAVYSQNVKDPPYNATGNGVTDDTQAIQDCIDAVHNYLVSHPADTGEVYFPTGVYRVSPVINQPYTCLNVYAKITLRGSTNPEQPTVNPSVIKVVDNTNGNPQRFSLPYLTVVGPANGLWDDLSGFGIRNMTFDGNTANNPTHLLGRAPYQYVDGGVAHMCLYVYTGSNIVVQDSVFQYFSGSQVLYIGDYTPPGSSNVTVNNCHFMYTGTDWGTGDYDTSALYTTGSGFTVTNCYFNTLHGAGTRGARTAMELHGPNQYCAYNVVDGHAYGANAVGDGPGSNPNQQYIGNTFTNMYTGILLWSISFNDDGSGGGGLQDCTISGNTFTINVNGWNTIVNYQWVQPTIGLTWCAPSWPDLPIENLTIENNTITFTNYGLPATSRNVEKDSMGMGIAFDNQAYPYMVTGVTISNNTVNNPLTNGIEANIGLAGDLTKYFGYCAIDNNTIVNPGSSPYATVQDKQHRMLSTEQKAAIRMSGNTNVVWIPDIPLDPSVSNIFTDTRSPRIMSYALWTNSRVGSSPTPNCVFDTTQTCNLADPSGWTPFYWGGTGANPWTLY